MGSVLRFDTPGAPAAKRRKSVRSCTRCQQAKKKCTVLSSGGGACQRCIQDGRSCSLSCELLSPASLNPSTANDIPTPLSASYAPVEPSLASLDDAPMMPNTRQSRASTELRYSTMLDMIHTGHVLSDNEPMKLVGDTNPLSALLRKDLKHKIVNNLCSFRTPDPLLSSQRPALRRLSGTNTWDWISYYKALNIHPAKFEHLQSLGCFQLPTSGQCGQLLETYFARVHPILPIVDKREFLSRFYGMSDPPQLILLMAIFLAAARHNNAFDDSNMADRNAVREICDIYHVRIRALVDIDILSERRAIMQVMLLDSLHWEGREGINSSLDSLSMAVRIGQEMGLHRQDSQHLSPIHRRLWWCSFAMDRFSAATEGTPLIINEIDCDVPQLQLSDFMDEDDTVRHRACTNVELAVIIQDTIRAFYAPAMGQKNPHTRLSELQRDQLSRRTLELENRFIESDCEYKDAWSLLFQVHIKATLMLIHRPFLLHQELTPTISTPNIASYKSRDCCRAWASEITSELESLGQKNGLRFSWPFTVYSLVNALLITWYDFSTPGMTSEQASARKQLITIIGILDEMGRTWWAAAAKHKLAEALLRIGDRVRQTNTEANNTVPLSTTPRSLEYSGERGIQTQSVDEQQAATSMTDPMAAGDLLFATPNITDDAAFWASLGLDFETELAEGIFGIT